MRLFLWDIKFEVKASIKLSDRFTFWVRSKKDRFLYQTNLGRWLLMKFQEQGVKRLLKGNWPPSEAPSSFGYFTTAKPREGVQQDAELIATVAQMLKNMNTCKECGR